MLNVNELSYQKMCRIKGEELKEYLVTAASSDGDLYIDTADNALDEGDESLNDVVKYYDNLIEDQGGQLTILHLPTVTVVCQLG